MKKGSFFQIISVSFFIGLLSACSEETLSEADIHNSESNMIEPIENTDNEHKDSEVELQSSLLIEDLENAVEESELMPQINYEEPLVDETLTEDVCIDTEGNEIDCI